MLGKGSLATPIRHSLAALLIVAFGTYWGRLIAMFGGHYVPESYLLVALGAWVLADPYALSTLRSFVLDRLTVLLAFVLAFSAIVGMLLGGNAQDAYSQARAIMAFLFAFFLARRSEVSPVVMLAILAAYLAYFVVIGPAQADVYKARFPVWIGIVGCYLAYRQGRLVVLVGTAALSVVLGILSNYRLELAASLLFPAFYIVRALFRTVGQIRRPVLRNLNRAAIACVIIIAIAMSFDTLYGKAYGFLINDSDHYAQIVRKANLFWHSVSAGVAYDSSLGNRITFLSVLWNNWLYVLIPLGLGELTAIKPLESHVQLNTLDSGVGFVALHFGVVPGTLILWMLCRRIAQSGTFDSLLIAGSFLGYFLVSAEAFFPFELAVSSGLALGTAAGIARPLVNDLAARPRGQSKMPLLRLLGRIQQSEHRRDLRAQR